MLNIKAASGPKIRFQSRESASKGGYRRKSFLIKIIQLKDNKFLCSFLDFVICYVRLCRHLGGTREGIAWLGCFLLPD